ncbi:MAG TPA: choice-of-anchor D domain-containing protein [Candidatus Sulfotelmatobacter sp.]|nr:choice-of-anchor D domain-containing protein [Candidatus Sulfotelmatobacter sp.]
MKLRVPCVFVGFLSLVLSMANGTSSAHLKATSTNGSVVGTQTAGTGNVPVTVKPDSLTFSEQLVGTRSAGKTVTFTNGGGVDVYFTNILIEGVDSNDFSFTTTCGVNGAGLAPGASCTSTIYYAPSFAGGDFVVQLYEGNFTEQEVSIGGTGTAVTIKPKSLTFPKTMVGGTSAPKTVTFTNVGPAALTITSLAWSGTEPYFSETNTCGSSVPAYSSCTFSITFSPLTAGTFTANLWIGDPDPSGPQKITVVGAGVAAADSAK